MRESEPELFEVELRKLKPARPTEDFLARLATEIPAGRPVRQRHAPAIIESSFCQVALRWLIPATAMVAVLIAVVSLRKQSSSPSQAKQQADAASPPAPTLLKADNVEVDQRIVMQDLRVVG